MDNTSSNGNGVSLKSYLETTVTRIESSITELRDDIKHLQAEMQNRYVTRTEHDLTISFFRNELGRVESDYKEKLNEQDENRERSMTKWIAIASVASGLIVGTLQLVLFLIA